MPGYNQSRYGAGAAPGFSIVGDVQNLAPLVPGGFSPVVLTNGSGSPITNGQVCYLSANDTAQLARSDVSLALASAMCICVATSIAAAGTGNFVFGGRVTGLSGGTVNTLAYLSATPGAIAATPDLAAGHFNTILGIWLDATTLYFNWQLPIQN